HTDYAPDTHVTITSGQTPYPVHIPAQNPQSPLLKYLNGVPQMPTPPNLNPMASPNYVGTYSPYTRSWTTSTRVDQRLGTKDSFYGRYSQGNYSNRSQFYGLPSLDWAKVPGNTQGSFQPNKSVALSHVHTFSPTLFNELLVTGTRTRMDVVTGDPTVCYNCALGLPNPFNVNQWPGLYNL